MSRILRTAPACLAAALALALAASPRASAQQPFPRQPALVAVPGGGTELLRAFLDREGIRPVMATELGNTWPGDDLIVICIGRADGLDPLRNPTDWARRVIQADGAALIATDQRTLIFASGVGKEIGAFNGNTVVADPRDCYGGLPDCPYAVPVSPEELRDPPNKPGPVWNVFRGLNKIATNQPTYIEDRFRYMAEYQYPLARLPKSSRAWGQGFRPPPLFAVGGDGAQQWDRPGYAFLAVADSSVFINQMIMEQGTDNLEFTLRTVEYLQGPGKHRKRCLFFENGRVVDRFDELRLALAKPKPKMPPEAVPDVGPIFGKNQDKFVELGDRLAERLQSNDWMHNTFVGPPDSPRERRRFGEWVEVILVALAVVVVLFLLQRSMRARQPTNLPVPPNTGAGAASTGPPGVFERRQKELVRRNNLYEPVRNLMRDFFATIGAPGDAGPRVPKILVSRAVRKPDSLRLAIRDLWRIAYGTPIYISAQRWFELEPYFERVRQAHADGKWRLETEEADA